MPNANQVSMLLEVAPLDVERRQVESLMASITSAVGDLPGVPYTTTNALDQPTSAVGGISSILASLETSVITATGGNPQSTFLSSLRSLTQTTETSAGQTSTAVPPISSTDGLSMGSKAAIGVVIPIVLISLAAAIFFLLRRRKRSQANNAQPGVEATDQPISDLIVVENKLDRHAVPETSELPGSPATAVPTHQSSKSNAVEAHASEIYSHAHYQDQAPQQLHADEIPNVKSPEILPANSTGLSDNDRWSHSQELHTPNDWTQRHELATPSRTASVYSDSQTLKSTGEQGDKDGYLEKLEAKRIAVAEERERLRRMEMLREEDERLEREIEEYKKTRAI